MKECFVTVDGAKIRYFDSFNEGPTLVLLHGLGASAERWEQVMPLFSKKYRIIIPDMIGFGYSDKPSADYTIDFFVKFLSKFLKKLSIPKTLLIGSSLGGQISAEFTSKYPDTVEKLVLVSPSGIMKHSTPALDAYVMAALYPSDDSAHSAYQMMAHSEYVDETVVNQFIERMKLPNAKLAFMSTILGLKNAPVITEKLTKIITPTLVIWGSQDPVIPIMHAHDFVANIKECSFHRMDDCGHTPYVDQPEMFYEIVEKFF